LEIEPILVPARQNQYGRADAAAAWMLLAKLYLNAEVYTGQKKYSECITYTKKVINAGFSLQENYRDLFRIGNHNSEEIIFTINFDGNYTQTYGGMTFLVHASVGGTMDPGASGVNSGWAGLRTTKNIVNLFPDETGDEDKRAIFYTDDQNKEIPNTPITTFKEGYAVPKYQNLDAEGNPGSSLEFVDTDFPVFRLADAYLMYAEAVLREGAGGSVSEAVGYINALRQRAYGDASGNIDASDLDLNFIIDERGRELYWECHRRTDLIRFGLFTDNKDSNPRGVWPWKGGTAAGAATESFRNVFPIPSAQIIANPQLEQNDGY
jgi:starch-binding outer membrane protein, SusD/RagB family